MVAKTENFDEIVFLLKEKLISMSDNDKNVFFAKPADNASFKGQCVGQQLYAQIASNVENFEDIKDRLCEIVGADYIDKYMENLEKLRKVKQDEIMNLTEHLYHFSQNSQLSELEPRFQYSCTLNEKAGKSLCFATKEEISPYIGKPSTNNPNEYQGISVFMDEPCLVLSGIDLKKYAVDVEKNQSYRYEVDKSVFQPLVSLSGEFTNEYASDKTAKIINVSGPFGLHDIYQADIPIYFILHAEDRNVLKMVWQQHINEGMSRYQAMEITQLKYPDKMYCLNKDKELQQQMQNAIQIERLKSKIVDRQGNENKTNINYKSKGVLTQTEVSSSSKVKIKENLKDLRYVSDTFDRS